MRRVTFLATFAVVETRLYKPFAITARASGHPTKLFTPVTVVNLRPASGGDIVATRVNAMWDTGAEMCLMSSRLASRLGIKFEKSCDAAGFTGRASVPVGYAYVSIIANGDIVDVLTGIVEETSPSGDYSFVIGLNFISKGALAICSTPLDTTLSFTIPTPEPVDFSALSSIEDRIKGFLPLSRRMEESPVVYGAKALGLIVSE